MTDKDQNRDYSPDPTLVSDEELMALRQESSMLSEDEKTLAEKILREHLPEAVLSVIKLAKKASNEGVRLNAAKYVVERNLGRLQDANALSKVDPLEKMLQQLTDND